MKVTIRLLVCLLFTPWVISCDNHDLGPVNIVSCDGISTVSYLNDIKPIVDENCSRCHNSGDFPTRDWTNKDLLKEYASEAARRVQLPVTDPDHMPLDPPELTIDEIQAIVCWAQQGAPVDN
jgi:hypothetical protein